MVENLLDSCSGASLVNGLFFLPHWQAHFKRVRAPQFRANTRQAVPAQVLVSAQECNKDPDSFVRLSIVNSFAMDLLVMKSFIDSGICRISRPWER